MQQKLTENEDEQKKNKILTPSALRFLNEKLDYYVVKQFKVLMEMLRHRVRPTWRGTLGLGKEVQVVVSDAKMKSFLAACRSKMKGKDWKFKVSEEEIKEQTKTRYVKRYKLQTRSEEALRSFILSFKGESPSKIMDQSYAILSGVK